MRKVLALILAICILFAGCQSAVTVMKPAAKDSGRLCRAPNTYRISTAVLADSGVVDSGNAEDVAEEEQEDEEKEEEKALEPVGIAGSNMYDLILNLERSVYAIPSPSIYAAPDQTVSTYLCGSSAPHEDFGMTVSYSLSSARNLSLIYGAFQVDTSFVRGENALRLVSKAYFSMCATMPCDAVRGAYAGQPRAWVEQVMDNLDDYGPGVGAVFGDAGYNLSWTRTKEGVLSSMQLSIVKIPEEPVQTAAAAESAVQ